MIITKEQQGKYLLSIAAYYEDGEKCILCVNNEGELKSVESTGEAELQGFNIITEIIDTKYSLYYGKDATIEEMIKENYLKDYNLGGR